MVRPLVDSSPNEAEMKGLIDERAVPLDSTNAVHLSIYENGKPADE